MSARTAILLWLAIIIGVPAFNVAVTFLAGGWTMIRRDLPILVREGLSSVIGATVMIGVALLVGPFVTLALVVGAYVLVFAGFRVWRHNHRPAPPSERTLVRREALNSPNGLQLRRGFLAFIVVFGLVIGLIDGWTSS